MDRSPDHPTSGLRDERGATIVESLIAAVIAATGLLALLSLLTTGEVSGAKTRARDGAVALAREVLERTRDVPYGSLSGGSSTAAASVLAPRVPGSTLAGGTWTVRRRTLTYTVTATACQVDDPSDGIAPVGPAFCTATAGGGSNSFVPGVNGGVGLQLLGLSVGLQGSLVSLVCSLLNPSPTAGNALDRLLGRTGLLGTLTAGGASVSLCPSSKGTIALDPNPADLQRVAVSVRWKAAGAQSTVRQSTVFANPGVVIR